MFFHSTTQSASRYAFLLCILFCSGATAQTNPDSAFGWKNNLVATASLTQVAYRDWSQGGTNTISWLMGVNGAFDYMQESYTWANKLKITFGQSKVGDQDMRKTDDELFFTTMFSQKFGWPVDPYVAATARTQIARGYKYTDTSSIGITDFFDPGYLTQSAGFTYLVGLDFKTRLGFAFKETFTKSYTNFADDPATKEIEKTRFETGIESVTDYKIVVMENVQYTAMLGLFSAFKNLDVWDVRWDNVITAKVNKWISMQFNLLVIYEKRQSLKTQIKENVGIGISYTLL